MDDCNARVVIIFPRVYRGSDSSMDDCNFRATFSSSRALYCSDSSMDDCNGDNPDRRAADPLFRFLYGRL